MAKMAEDTYSRGQLEWALWRSFDRDAAGVGRIPQIFRTRIKRLLDIDRELELGDEDVAPGVEHAFASPPGVASGDVAYRAVDAFSLAIGLDLLDIGFKQTEIVTLMRYLRPDLEKQFPDLLEPPSLIDRQLYPAEDFPALPAYREDGHELADRRLFVILQKVELTEILPRSPRRQPKKPVILRPVFCEGVERLGRELDQLMPYHRRALTILELASTAQAVRKHLADAPVVRRGRPRG